MTFQGDPFRTLGVTPGASLNEIKSAYRRLAKQYHPDAAGERALPRFLAIQAAYERLVDGEGRLRARGPGPAGQPGRSGTSWPGGSPRSRASRDAWRTRRASWSASAGPAGGSAAGSSAPGSDTAGPPPRTGRNDTPGRDRPRQGRGPRRATPGSTTYDEAQEHPFDPEWQGGSWYGASSGTYWTINPREYADPRKHGPEYQARARRASRDGEPERNGEPNGEPGGGARDDGERRHRPDSPAEDRPGETASTAGEAGAAPETDTSSARAGWGWSGEARSSTGGDPRVWAASGWSYESRGQPPGGVPGAEAAGSARDAGREGTRRAPWEPPPPLPDLEAMAGRAAPQRLRAAAAGANRRVALAVALLGWPPLGFAAGNLVSAAVGCGSGEACPAPLELAPWLVQPAVVGGLLAVPLLAGAAAFATLVALVAAVVAAVLLSISGAAYQREASGLVLGVTVSVAWAVALVLGLVLARKKRTSGD